MHLHNYSLIPDGPGDVFTFSQALAEAFRLGSALAALDVKPADSPRLDDLMTRWRTRVPDIFGDAAPAGVADQANANLLGATEQGWLSAQSDFEERVLNQRNRPEALLHTAGAQVADEEWVLDAVITTVRGQMRMPGELEEMDSVLQSYEEMVHAGVEAALRA